jgi:hypothetical protein
MLGTALCGERYVSKWLEHRSSHLSWSSHDRMAGTESPLPFRLCWSEPPRKWVNRKPAWVNSAVFSARL